MFRSTSRKVLAAMALVLVGWWLWSSDDEPQLEEVAKSNDQKLDSSSFESAIRPITNANTQEAAQTGVLFNSLDPDLQSSVHNRFSEAVIAQKEGDNLVAEELLNQLINDHPQLVEPYINLAAIYARGNKLAEAQTTLMAGLNANQNTATLFESLQQVLGAQAAEAYQKAFNNTATDPVVFDLPLATDIVALSSNNNATQDSANDDKQELELANKELASARKEMAALKSEIVALSNNNATQDSIDDDKQELELANKELASARKEMVTLKSEYEKRIASLQQELASQAILVDNASKTSEPAVVVSIPTESETQTSVVAAVTPPTTPELEVVSTPVQSDADKERLAQEAILQAAIKKREQNAIEAVQRWAKAWSDQDLQTYVAQYIDTYEPSESNISHDQWVLQRRARLGNKKFIRVKVSRFAVDDLGDRFSVSFSQNYQSNTVRDTITKKLTFIKGNDDWSAAKIVKEEVVSG